MTTETPIQVSAQAAAIMAKNSYWSPRSPDIRVDAIAFEEPSFLGGPFEGGLGLVYIAYEPHATPLQTQLDETAQEVLAGTSTAYMPHSARQRIAAAYPDGVEFHWDAANRTSYSNIDLPYISDEVRSRLKFDGSRCSPFAQTPEGLQILRKDMTEAETAAHRKALEEAVGRIHHEMRLVQRCAERPYSVRLQGNDDCSWTSSCATLEEVDTLLTALRNRGRDAVYDLMHFTN